MSAKQVQLANVLADVRRGIWKPPQPELMEAPKVAPTFHEYASAWVAGGILVLIGLASAWKASRALEDPARCA